MAETSSIEWTDATWNPITGCSVVSPGCTNCYAMRLAGTRLKHHPSRAGLTEPSKAGPVWTGEVRLNERWLDQPLKWRTPRRIFVCAHGDLFHESVPDAWIDRVFATMALAPQHTFQVLTKRAARMRAYVTAMADDYAFADRLWDTPEGDPAKVFAWSWPLPNVWLGVSAEDQRRLDERAPDLAATPAAVRFLSVEPLLGPVDAAPWLWEVLAEDGEPPRDGIDWVIVGGENGDRPMHPDWVLSLRDQCAAAGVAFFFKQWGSYGPDEVAGRHLLQFLRPDGSHGGFFEPGCAVMEKRGKKAAGRLLDGVEHNGMPEVRHGV